MDPLSLGQGPASEVSFVVISERYTPRFLAKINRRGPDECWLWTASFVSGGYGAFSWEGQTLKAHRLAWMHAYGDIPEGLSVCHKCDNPPCCNPRHLFLGTALDNARDRNSKRRQAIGERQGPSKLTEDQVRAIRASALSNSKAAKEFGVSQGLISFIRTRKYWRHVA